MRKLNAYATFLISLIVFVPLLFVSRGILGQYISEADLILAFPIGLYLGLVMAMLSLAKYDTGRFTDKELKAYRVLIIGGFVLAIPLWIMAVGKLSTSIVFSSSIGLLFTLYDLLALVRSLQTIEQLRRIVLWDVLLPAIVACVLSVLTILYTHWQSILNPVAIFFICRAAMISKSRTANIQT